MPPSGLFSRPEAPTRLGQQCRWPHCGQRFLTPGELKRHRREARHFGDLPAGMKFGDGIARQKDSAKPRKTERKVKLARGKPFPWTPELIKQAAQLHSSGLSWAEVGRHISPGVMLSAVAVKTMVKRKLKGEKR